MITLQNLYIVINILAYFIIIWWAPAILILHLRCLIHDRNFSMSIWDLLLSLSILWLLIPYIL